MCFSFLYGEFFKFFLRICIPPRLFSFVLDYVKSTLWFLFSFKLDLGYLDTGSRFYYSSITLLFLTLQQSQNFFDKIEHWSTVFRAYIFKALYSLLFIKKKLLNILVIQIFMWLSRTIFWKQFLFLYLR